MNRHGVETTVPNNKFEEKDNTDYTKFAVTGDATVVEYEDGKPRPKNNPTKIYQSFEIVSPVITGILGTSDDNDSYTTIDDSSTLSKPNSSSSPIQVADCMYIRLPGPRCVCPCHSCALSPWKSS